MGKNYDFSGWATKNDVLCSDGRTIRRNAFAEQNGKRVPLVWNHQHGSADEVLGHADLENREEGVYAYCSLNETVEGQRAKMLVKHGDITALSIYANQLRQERGNVVHGRIREVSLVLAGANDGAFIDNVMIHGDDSEEEMIAFFDAPIELSHSAFDEPEIDDEEEIIEEPSDDEENEEEETMAEMMHADGEKTVQDVVDSMTEEQKNVMYALIGKALEEAGADEDESEGGKEMKHNAFDEEYRQDDVLCHADQEEILAIAKNSSVGSLQNAIHIYAEESGALQHGMKESDLTYLFPEYKDVYPGAPEMITRDYTWVTGVINGVKKSPISRIRTRQADVKGTDITARGYKKGKEKAYIGNWELVKRTTDPQTIYVKDKLNRDDIIDITDFDVVNYQYTIMKEALNELLALSIMIGDGKSAGDDKVEETHVRSIWHDDELYTIHQDVNITAAKTALQGSDTSKNFGDNYVYAEAIVESALYAREDYKGTGNVTFYCTPHLLNQMLLARDLNGRRIYSSKADLAAALNVKDIETVEQFANKTRTTTDSKTKKLLGIFVNLSDYMVGSTKGGEITKFNQFDIDFNQEKYLIETRVSGALTRIKSAIVLEEDVTPAAQAEG